MRARLALALATLLLLATSVPARAAPALALPDTVRIDIGAAGTAYGVIGSTASLRVTNTDGSRLYEGIQRVVVRTDARRLADADVALPPPVVGATVEERLNRAALLREARLAERLSPRAIVRVPFEVGLLRDADDDLGRAILRADAIAPLRFEAIGGGALSFNGRLYHGWFELAKDEDDRFTVIDVVNTHDYLVSVVGSEVPTDWHRQALEAQAIAARTYLLKHLGSHGAFDLYGDERDQAYKGIGGEADSTLRAVDETSGLVATYGGAPIDAFYSANAGGVTEDSENVWLNPVPYLRSVPSPADAVALRSSWGASSYEWTKEYTEPQLRHYLEVRGVVVGSIQGIEVVEKSPSGAVLDARVRGTLASHDVVKDSTRWYFGLKSQLFTVSFKPADQQEVVDLSAATARARIGDLAQLGADRTATLVGAQAAGADGGAVVTSFRTTGYLYRLPAHIEFQGKGYGHRVGMSQWGMEGMAQQGATFEDILKHYYVGTGLTKIEGP